MSIINFKKNQVLLFKYDNPISNIISVFTGYYTHAGVIVKEEKDYVWILQAVGTFRGELYESKGLWKKFKFLTKIKKLFSGEVIVSKCAKSHLKQLYDNNRLQYQTYLEVSDVKLNEFVTKTKGMKYDYFSIISIFVAIVFKKDIVRKNKNKLFCSELAARYIQYCTNLDILSTINQSSFEDITPEELNIFYNKYRDRNYIIKRNAEFIKNE